MRGRFATDLPTSGLPGLRYRRDTKTWVVSLNVPTGLRGLLRNARNRPLTRLERSTGEKDEARARRAYPEVLRQLEHELAEKALEAGATANQKQNVTQAVGQIYQEIKTDDNLLRAITRLVRERTQGSPINHKNPLAISKREPQVDWKAFEAHLFQKATELLLGQKGVELRDRDLELAARALKSAIKEVSKYGEALEESGFLATDTELGSQLSKAAEAPKPITLWEVAKHKIERNKLSKSAKEAHEYAIRAWLKIIKKNTLDDVNTQNLNTFLETLVLKGWNGKPLKPDSANSMAIVIASLVKHQSLRDGIARSKPLYRKVKNDRREEKLRQRDKAAKREDVKLALDYAYLHEKDRFRWLWLLLVNNTTLRVSESLSLKWKDLIELEGAWYFDLKFSKTAEGIRYVPLNSRLEKWLLPSRGRDGEYVINNNWPNCKNPRNGPGNWTRLLEKKLNLDGRLNPHAFRHAAGGDLTYELPEGIKKKLMGHSGGITDHYTREDLKKLREAAEHIGIAWEPPAMQGSAIQRTATAE
jgi:integrase